MRDFSRAVVVVACVLSGCSQSNPHGVPQPQTTVTHPTLGTPTVYAAGIDPSFYTFPICPRLSDRLCIERHVLNQLRRRALPEMIIQVFPAKVVSNYGVVCSQAGPGISCLILRKYKRQWKILSGNDGYNLDWMIKAGVPKSVAQQLMAEMTPRS